MSCDDRHIVLKPAIHVSHAQMAAKPKDAVKRGQYTLKDSYSLYEFLCSDMYTLTVQKWTTVRPCIVILLWSCLILPVLSICFGMANLIVMLLEEL